MALDRSSKNRLTARTREHFGSGTLFDAIARAVCAAGVLPRKELYESWEVARRVHRRFRGGRLVELAAGHGLLSHILCLMDPSLTPVLAVDPSPPKSAAAIAASMRSTWPQLDGRIEYRRAPLDEVLLAPEDLVVSVHACGGLTDQVLARASAVGARVAVLPCCHDFAAADQGGLDGWVDGSLAIDATRALRLGHAGYRVWTQTIAAEITPKNRLLLGAARASTQRSSDSPSF